MSWCGQAVAKLDAELPSVKGGKIESVLKNPVHDVLIVFCQQNEEFAQAVVEGKSLTECVAKVSTGVRDSISDAEVYRKAAAFYFRGATVKLEPRILLEPEEIPMGAVINLADFF